MEFLTVITNANEYKALWGTALYWAALRKVEADQADTISKAADMGKFKAKGTWPKWEVSFKNYLSSILGVNSMKLSCVVWYQADPDRTSDFQGDFIEKIIACAPLISAHFQAHTRKVH